MTKMWHIIPLLLFPVALIPLLRMGQEKWFSKKEFFALEGLMIMLLAVGFFVARWAAVQDTEIWSGHLTAKDSGYGSCCHCTEDCDSDGHCTTICDHSGDYWWTVDVSTGDTVTILNCTPSPVVPQAWNDAIIGEPAVVAHRYTNYLLAHPEHVLSNIEVPSHLTDQVTPDYPQVHSHYRIDRAINTDTAMPVTLWNSALMKLNDEIGSIKEVNVVVIATTYEDRAYSKIIERDWLLGKKNDLIFVFGVSPVDGHTIRWVEAVSISQTKHITQMANDALVHHSIQDVEPNVAILKNIVTDHFERTPMSEFRSLMSHATPGRTGTIILYVLATLGCMVGSHIMTKRNPIG